MPSANGTLTFRYIALGTDNRAVTGTVEAASDRHVEDWLLQSGMRVVSIRPAAVRRWLPEITLSNTNVVKRKEVVLFSRQLATLLHSGTPLLTSIALLRDQTRGPAFRKVLDTLSAQLKTGVSLHEAMGSLPKVFPKVYVGLVEAGERSGTLEEVLEQLATYLEKDQAVVQKAKRALTYPLIVGVVGAAVVGIQVTMVLPSLAELLYSFNAPLPLLTRIVLGSSTLLQRGALPMLGLLAAGAAWVYWYWRKPAGRLKLDRLLLNSPGLGRLMVQQNLGRFSRTMALLLKSGLTLPEALSLARHSISNRYFLETLAQVRSQVMEGRTLAQAFGGVGFVPGLYVQMVRAGESSGALEQHLLSMADFYEREVDEQVTTVVGLMEPAITVAMGIVVAMLALAVLLPMYNIFDTLQKK